MRQKRSSKALQLCASHKHNSRHRNGAYLCKPRRRSKCKVWVDARTSRLRITDYSASFGKLWAPVLPETDFLDFVADERRFYEWAQLHVKGHRGTMQPQRLGSLEQFGLRLPQLKQVQMAILSIEINQTSDQTLAGIEIDFDFVHKGELKQTDRINRGISL